MMTAMPYQTYFEHRYLPAPAGYKPAPLYDGRYFANENGDIWGPYGPKKSVKRGNLHIISVTDGTRLTFTSVARLVALAWLGYPPNYDCGEVMIGKEKYCVNHKNGNTDDNRACNLEWITRSQSLANARAKAKAKRKAD